MTPGEEKQEDILEETPVLEENDLKKVRFKGVTSEKDEDKQERDVFIEKTESTIQVE